MCVCVCVCTCTCQCVCLCVFRAYLSYSACLGVLNASWHIDCSSPSRLCWFHLPVTHFTGLPFPWKKCQTDDDFNEVDFSQVFRGSGKRGLDWFPSQSLLLPVGFVRHSWYGPLVRQYSWFVLLLTLGTRKNLRIKDPKS